MPSLNNTTDGRNSGFPRKEYITTSAFNNDLLTYTTSRSATGVVTGTLTPVTGGTAANCPANRILRENGRRLYKDANVGVNTLLVGVYDSISGLSGLIDPNSPRFAVYNGDRSVYLDNGLDPLTGLKDQGPPIYTRGTVTALGSSTETAIITACSAASGVATYTAANNFSVGQNVTITGIATTAYNLTNAIIASRSDTQFTVVNATATGATGTGVATVTLPGMTVGGGGSSVTGGLTLSTGPFIQTPVAVTTSTISATTGTATLDLSLGSFFIVTTAGTGSGGVTLTLTLVDSAPGAIINILVVNGCGQTVTLAFNANNSIITTPLLTQTVANGARGLYVGAVFA